MLSRHDELVELVRRELSARFGLTTAWLYVFEREDDEEILDAPSTKQPRGAWTPRF